ncbi:hypothetical protein D1007_20944 [Hordeum vulgare]|nr:hypothetical protein D1007_20944 [Hordeum vulgare]
MVTWISRSRTKVWYLEGKLHNKWVEWKADLCWITHEDFPNYCCPSTKKITRDPHSSHFGAKNDKLMLHLERILSLTAKGLTIELVGANFL